MRPSLDSLQIDLPFNTVSIVSTFLTLLTQPLTWIAVLLAASVVLGSKSVWSRRLTALSLAVVLLMGWQPLPDLLLRQLEGQYAEIQPDANLQAYYGIVVLGGSTEPAYIARAHRQPLLTDAAERMTASLPLLRNNPTMHAVYTGGGPLQEGEPSEARQARTFFESQGIPVDRVKFESMSRTTYENATLSALLPGIDTKQRWLLVTSAWHMPRAMATFTKAGWNVTAYPVDFRSGTTTPWTTYGFVTGLRSWHAALHELVGALAYQWTDRM